MDNRFDLTVRCFIWFSNYTYFVVDSFFFSCNNINWKNHIISTKILDQCGDHERNLSNEEREMKIRWNLVQWKSADIGNVVCMVWGAFLCTTKQLCNISAATATVEAAPAATTIWQTSNHIKMRKMCEKTT